MNDRAARQTRWRGHLRDLQDWRGILEGVEPLKIVYTELEIGSRGLPPSGILWGETVAAPPSV